MTEHDKAVRLGPKATEDEPPAEIHTRALTLRAMIPNAVTAAAL
ncbi:MAG TPA: CDP-diacylglycerol O-phosphatidyltransferase, partial [Erythrobacter sp.]|nr:CDP-diacylglycerol O-phosphatidyltransferase [Erythrobacter sp.]